MRTVLVTSALLVGIAVPMHAQIDEGAIVRATAAAMDMDGATSFSFSGSVGYQFTRLVGIEIEVTVTPTFKPALPPNSPVVYSSTSASAAGSLMSNAFVSYPLGGSNREQAVLFTTNVRVQLPTANARVTPFFIVGGGAGNVRRTADIGLPIPIAFTSGPGTLLPTLPVPFTTTTDRVTSSSTDLALMLGGGLDVRLAAHVSVGVDLRYYRLMALQESNIGRFGAGLRYRF